MPEFFASICSGASIIGKRLAKYPRTWYNSGNKKREVKKLDCLFCKIVSGAIPSKKVYEDDDIYAFLDINPQAPVHVLVVPKKHIASADEINGTNSGVVAKIFERIPAIAASQGLKNGYRIISNCGDDACQSVKHLHFHILGGKQLPDNMG